MEYGQALLDHTFISSIRFNACYGGYLNMKWEKEGVPMRFWRRLKFLFKFHKSVPFLKDYFLSKEVSFIKKVTILLLIVLYIVIPFDVIPDYLLLFGLIDDVVVVTFILQLVIKMAPPSIREKHNFNNVKQ